MSNLDLQALTQWAGTAWLILVGMLALLLGVLTLLLPYFVWQISRWTRTAARESARLNTQMEQLLTLLSVRPGLAAEPDPQAQFSFQSNVSSDPDGGQGEGGEKGEAEGGGGELSRAQASDALPEEEPAAPSAAISPGGEAAAAQEGKMESPPGSAPPTEGARQALLLPPDPRRPAVTLARCGWCDHKLSYREAMAGRKVKCPSCSRPLELP